MILEDQRTRREVDAADTEVDLRRLKHAHVAREHVVGVQQDCAEVAQLVTTPTTGFTRLEAGRRIGSHATKL